MRKRNPNLDRFGIDEERESETGEGEEERERN